MISLFSKLVQIKRKGNSFPPFHIIMRSLLVLDFMLARAANVWVDDDLSLLQTRAVLQNGDLVFSDSMDNVITEDDALLTLISGQCVTDGLCVSSPNFPNNYGNNERCELSVTWGNTEPAPFAVEMFNTEANHDILTVDGVRYTGIGYAHGIGHGHGINTISWESDGSVTAPGFRICLPTTTTTTTTTTTEIPAIPVADEASAVGDPHIITSAGRMYDLKHADAHHH